MMNAKYKAYERLKELNAEADSATYDWLLSGKFEEWEHSVRSAFRRLYGDRCEHLKAFDDISYNPVLFTDTTPDSVFKDEFLGGIKSAQGIVRSAIHEFTDYEIAELASSPDPASTPPNSGNATLSDPLQLVRLICERFYLVATQLRIRHQDRPTLEIHDEYDVQDLMHGLLHLYFDDIRPEEWCPSMPGNAPEWTSFSSRNRSSSRRR
jgi:hypothetical protein